MATPGRLVEVAALVTEVPRFTPAQWQRLFWDAGLKGATVHLFLRESIPDWPQATGAWNMVVDTGDGMVDLEAIRTPLPSARFLDATAKGAESEEALLAAATAHGARIEIAAIQGRCPPSRAHELVARAAAGVLRTTRGVAWLEPGAGILMDAQSVVTQIRDLPRDAIPVELYATLRRTPRPPMVVIDSTGLAAFDLSDVEIAVDEDDADAAHRFVSQLVSELVARGRRIVEGERIDGPLGLRWKVAMGPASVPPLRAVLRLSLAG